MPRSRRDRSGRAARRRGQRLLDDPAHTTRQAACRDPASEACEQAWKLDNEAITRLGTVGDPGGTTIYIGLDYPIVIVEVLRAGWQDSDGMARRRATTAGLIQINDDHQATAALQTGVALLHDQTEPPAEPQAAQPRDPAGEAPRCR